MKNIVHLFTREVVEDAIKGKRSKNFEFMAALLMQRLYEEQWGVATMIGFRPLAAASSSADLMATARHHGDIHIWEEPRRSSG